MYKPLNYFLDKLNEKKYSNYSLEERKIAAYKLYTFFNNLSNLQAYERMNNKQLSYLDMFLYAYVNVISKPKDKEDNQTSHDLIGTLLTDKSVCQGYTSLLEFICDELEIPFLYKTTEGPFGAHGNFQVIVTDEQGIKHCLHCDPYLDSKDDPEDIIALNATLIPADNINNYHNYQHPSSQFLFWEYAFNNIPLEEKKKNLDSVSVIEALRGEKKETVIETHYLILKRDILELNRFFRIELGRLENNDEIFAAYEILKKHYDSIVNPITRENLYNHIKHILKISYVIEKQMSENEAIIQSDEDLNRIIENTNKRHDEKWIR